MRSPAAPVTGAPEPRQGNHAGRAGTGRAGVPARTSSAGDADVIQGDLPVPRSTASRADSCRGSDSRPGWPPRRYRGDGRPRGATGTRRWEHIAGIKDLSASDRSRVRLPHGGGCGDREPRSALSPMAPSAHTGQLYPGVTSDPGAASAAGIGRWRDRPQRRVRPIRGVGLVAGTEPGLAPAVCRRPEPGTVVDRLKVGRPPWGRLPSMGKDAANATEGDERLASRRCLTGRRQGLAPGRAAEPRCSSSG